MAGRRYHCLRRGIGHAGSDCRLTEEHNSFVSVYEQWDELTAWLVNVLRIRLNSLRRKAERHADKGEG